MHSISSPRRPHATTSRASTSISGPASSSAIAGVSGAGKSSLALDTLYSEGQRRFVESFSPYARQFLERLERPPIGRARAGGGRRSRSIAARPVKSSRSTVATMADLEPYFSAPLHARGRACLPDAARRPRCAPTPAGAAERVARAHAGAARARHATGIAVAGPPSGYLDRARLAARPPATGAPRRRRGARHRPASRRPRLGRGRARGRGHRRSRQAGRASERAPPRRRPSRTRGSAAATPAPAPRRAVVQGGQGAGLDRVLRLVRGLACPSCARVVRSAAPRAVLVPVPDRRVPRVPRLRPHHRHRLGQGLSRTPRSRSRAARSGPWSGQLDDVGARSVLTRVLRAEGHPHRQAVARPHRRAARARASRARARGPRRQVPRRAQGLVPMARDAHVQDARPRACSRATAPTTCAARATASASPPRRCCYRVGGLDLAALAQLELREARARLRRPSAPRRARVRWRAAELHRAARVPRARSGLGVPHARPPGAHALRRRGAARLAHRGARRRRSRVRCS